MAGRDTEDREGLRKICLDPVGELRCGFPIAGDYVLDSPMSLSRVIGVEDAAEVGRDLRLHGHLRDVGHRVLHDMKLAALPRHAGQHSFSGSPETGVVIADDERHPEHASGTERLEKLPPVDLGFAQGDATSEDRPLAVGADTDRREEGTGHDRAINSHLLVPGIKDEVGDFAEGTVSPGVELLVELGGGAADLRRG